MAYRMIFGAKLHFQCKIQSYRGMQSAAASLAHSLNVHNSSWDCIRRVSEIIKLAWLAFEHDIAHPIVSTAPGVFCRSSQRKQDICTPMVLPSRT